MTAILKREFKNFFDNMLGYVIVAIFLAFFGLYFTVYNIRNGYPFVSSFLYDVCGYLSFLIPILTMKSISEERKSKTDQLLLTAPVSVTQIVIGKFLAMVCVFAIPVLFLCFCPIFIYLTAGSMHFLVDYSSILAFFLVGVSYIAIGMFLSSVTESQIIAAVLTFVVLFLMQIMTGLTSFLPKTEGKNALIFVGVAFVLALILYKMTQNIYASFVCFSLLTIAIAVVYYVQKTLFYNAAAKILNAIPYEDTLNSFIYSVFNIPAIVMYLSVIVFFNVLTIQSIQKRRYS